MNSGMVMEAAHPKVRMRVMELSSLTTSTDSLTRRGSVRGMKNTNEQRKLNGRATGSSAA